MLFVVLVNHYNFIKLQSKDLIMRVTANALKVFKLESVCKFHFAKSKLRWILQITNAFANNFKSKFWCEIHRTRYEFAGLV